MFKEPLRAAVVATLFLVIAADAILFLIEFPDRLITIPMVIGIVLLSFLAIERDFAEIVINASDGISLRRAIKQYEDLSNLFNTLFSQNSADALDTILNEAKATRDVWSRLIIYRTCLRQLLWRRAQPEGYTKSAPSIQEMLNLLEERGILSTSMASDARRLGEDTYNAQWIAGSQPSAERLRDTLRNSEVWLRQLHKELAS